MAKKKMDLFHILKLNTSVIIKNNFNIDLTLKEAKEKGYIVAIGDNQLLEFIRRLRKIEYNRDIISNLYKDRELIRETKNQPNARKKILEIQDKIDSLLFVPDLITIKCDTSKKDYKDICKHGFNVNILVGDIKYSYSYCRLCAGAGQLRRNSSLFVSNSIYNSLEQIMMCGLTKSSIGKINLAKFSAYFALYTSATRKVTKPRICVIPDFEHTLKDQDISWVYDDEFGDKKIKNTKSDFDINAFDGSGIISPEMAKIWQKDLKLRYTPSSFIIRSAWIKGLVSVFDFHLFAEKIAKKDKIVDVWGKEWDIDKIDVILTASQFKMYKKYTSWEQYMYYHNMFRHIFGVARVNKEVNNFYTPLNYQYIQSNDFTEDSIKELANTTVDWLNKILSGDILYSKLFVIGAAKDDEELDNYESSLSSNIAKALIYNENILKDEYVKQKINQMMEKKIRQAKIGKLLVEGSYDFIIPDLYALCEHAFGMYPKGLIPPHYVYSKRWVNKGSEQITLMRSPLVAPSENQKRFILYDKTADEWFKHIKDGNILSIWSMEVISMSDADFDGDIALTSDNQTLLNAVNGKLPIITYEKKKAKEQRLNFKNFANMDVKSFDSPIGSVTNLASNLYAMLPLFSKDSDEYKEIRNRIDILRQYQGSAIDKTKGEIYTPPPAKWTKKQRYEIITDDMSEEEKQALSEKNKKIAFENRICCDKKSYFFGYIYPRKMEENNKYKKNSNAFCLKKLNMKISDLQTKENKTPEEKLFLNNYYKYMPLFNSKSSMNVLARYIEDIQFHNNWKLEKTVFDYKELLSSNNFKPSKNKLSLVVDFLKSFNNIHRKLSFDVSNIKSTVKDEWGNVNFSNFSSGFDEDSIDKQYNNFNVLFEYAERELYQIIPNKEELTDYVIYALYNSLPNISKTLLWNVFGEQIVENIKKKSTVAHIPVESETGEEYLGKKYKMIDVGVK